jgi:hypothetical protein
MAKKKTKPGPKVLLFDIETAPMLAYVWGLWDQNVGLNQIEEDWHVLSWAAKWLGDPVSEIMYMDQRGRRDITNDKKLLKQIWLLLDEADIVITQNGKKFDVKKLNARFLHHGFPPPSSFKHIDVYQLAKKHFAFTSNKLEYLTNKFNRKYKKLTEKRKFVGFNLWTAVLKGVKSAWYEMEKYNKYDVFSLEEWYHIIAPWDASINFSLYHDSEDHICSCGSTKFKKNGYWYTATGKFQRYKCLSCGKESRSRQNLFSKEKKQSLHVRT